jgi:hypothetical protein
MGDSSDRCSYIRREEPVEDPMVRAVVVAFVSGIVAAALGFAVARESIELPLAIFVWGVGTLLALGYLGVAVEGPIEVESEPMARAIKGVLSAYGVAGLIGGAVGGLVGSAVGAPKTPE